jgi:leucyl/phenylalanyl-tRNA--protein transferase
MAARARPEAIDPELLLSAYAAGIFPMADEETGEIGWYSPDPRGILPLDGFAVSRSLRQTLRKEPFTIAIDQAFEAVMRCCAERDETWISEEIIASYVRLHAMGRAHSVEAWRDGALVGGLYGVAIGGAFFGESMFSVATGSSKVCLVALVERLRERMFVLLDTQFVTAHLARFGAVEIPQAEYLRILREAIALPRTFID